MPHTTALGAVYDSGKFSRTSTTRSRQAKLGELPARAPSDRARQAARKSAMRLHRELRGGEPGEPAWVE